MKITYILSIFILISVNEYSQTNKLHFRNKENGKERFIKEGAIIGILTTNTKKVTGEFAIMNDSLIVIN